MSTGLSMLFTFIIAFVGAKVGQKLHFPASFMIGSMLAVMFFSVLTDTAYFPQEAKVIAQIAAGIFIGQKLTRSDVINLKYVVKPTLLLLVILTMNTFILGFAFSYFFHWNVLTGLLATTPGGLMDTTLIAADFDSEIHIVAIMQLVRSVGVLLLFPTWIKLFSAEEAQESVTENIESASKKQPLNKKHFLIVMLVGISGGLLGYFLGFPAGTLSLSLLFSALFKLRTNISAFPIQIRQFAQILAGSMVGSSFTRGVAASLKTFFLPALLLIAVYLLISYLYAQINKRKGWLDFTSALFASCPAGATDIALLSADYGVNMNSVAMIQIARLIHAVGIMPLLYQLVSFFL
ncbi:AbrB family transcriptional regulator [Tetragenococcus koreensis]|uniref:Membrane protein n=1 Tax=Tetragenococcus koreensis TaxID=290335 RepID=A0AAN4UCS8_9ENTE|nr:AbrB family transcriptional regulator [Tetragenococcus koreensis]AYW44569.1 ammonia monooxygenase [Tetragenococcus koreensis]MCF1584537.1 AbrB family transcriptional regulator [Tetragenococcus koreensis]MCF1614086.1 AbrB family transcriptional regulator [Tetragenococcus koreensis]MCF1619305.1 AbrB family transcriptional regulator [Tetragenococcus koreensis]MCF1623864.1 AbrB family transcriptional regulator [Tetragenococcus koreensis]